MNVNNSSTLSEIDSVALLQGGELIVQSTDPYNTGVSKQNGFNSSTVSTCNSTVSTCNTSLGMRQFIISLMERIKRIFQRSSGWWNHWCCHRRINSWSASALTRSIVQVSWKGVNFLTCSTSPVAQAQQPNITPTDEMMAPSADRNRTGGEAVERYREEHALISGGRLSNINENPQFSSMSGDDSDR